MEATAKIILDKRKHSKNKEGKHPVKLQVIHDRKHKWYSLQKKLRKEWQFFTPDEFNSVMSKSPRGTNKDIRKKFDNLIRKAEDIIEGMGYFSFYSFEQEFLNKSKEWDSVFHAFESHIQTLKNENRPGYASSFNCAYNSVKNFSKRKDLKFSDITPSWLKNYEQWMLKEGNSPATTGIYTRTLRRLFNIAIEDHGVKAEYPFRKYSPKQAKANKRALSPEDISKIMNYEAPEGTGLHFAKDMFLFSFFANGMNLGDIFRLKYSNIQGNEIFFVRTKTKNKRTEVNISVPYIDTLKTIVTRWGQKAINKNVYIFPVLGGDMTEEQKKKRINDKISNINNRLKKIADELGIGHLSTVYARHSYATIMKNSGASTEYIQEMLGHSDVSVTQNYLSGFEQETRHKNAVELENKIKNHKTG